MLQPIKNTPIFLIITFLIILYLLAIFPANNKKALNRKQFIKDSSITAKRVADSLRQQYITDSIITVKICKYWRPDILDTNIK